MIKGVTLNNIEDKKKHLAQATASAALGTVIGLGTTYTIQALAHRNELKDEFKSAKSALKDAKKQNLGEEAIKGAKDKLKGLRSEVNKNALGFTKQMIAPMIAAFGVISLTHGLIKPVLSQYLSNKNSDKEA